MTEEVPKRKLWKRVIRWTAGVLLTAIVLLSAIFGYLYTNQDQLRNVVVSQVNNYLAEGSEVAVNEIRLDFFTQFPDVSVRFNEVFCKEVFPRSSQDTLFYFQDVYFEFNLWKLLKSEYELNGITLDHGHVELRVHRTGRDNWHFWKESADTTNSPLSINLEDVRLTHSDIYFQDQGADFETHIDADKLGLKGALNNGAFASKLNWLGGVRYLKIENEDYFPNRSVSALLDLHLEGDSTFIDGGEIEIDGLALAAKGHIANGENEWMLTGKNLSLSKFVSLLPPSLIPDKSLVDADGTFALNLGLGIRDKQVFIEASTQLEKADLNLQRSGLRLSNLSLKGDFTNEKGGSFQESVLRVTDIHANTRTGSINGGLTIRNFESPTFSIAGNMELDFEEALALAGTNFHESASGTLAGDFRIEKRFSSFAAIQNEGLEKAYLQGSMNLISGGLKVRDSGMELDNLTTSMKFSGSDIQLEDLKFTSNQSDFEARGSIENAIQFGATPSPKFRLSLHSNNLVLEDILAWQLDHRSEATESSESMHFDYVVNITVDQFEHRSFNASKLQGQIYSQGKDIVGNDLRFQAVDGNVNADFRWHPEGNVYLLTTKGGLRSVNISELFRQFDNFGQSSLTSENIYGVADVDYAVRIYFDENMSPALESLVSETDFRIANGRLTNYKPLESLSRFAEISELQDVQFATLENHLSIDNQNIHIPGMTVKSSVLELWVEGDHSFNNDIDYSLKLQLLDALGTRRQTSDELSEFIIESNREQPLIPVRIYGTLDDPRISLDRSLLQQGVRDEWKSQGEELRQLMNGEEDPTESEPEYIIEWNDTRDTTRRR